jgi:hypothetical protein
VLAAKLSTMVVVLIDLFEIEAKLRSNLFSEAFFKVTDLAWIFEEATHASDNSSSFFDSKLLLEEVRICSIE